MSLSSVVSLGALRLQAQQRADLVGSSSVTTPEWNQYISQSYKELYDLLVAAYGNEYYVKAPYSLALTGAQFYTMPSDMYKLLGVDLQYSSAPNGWITLKRFEFIERNKYQYPNTTASLIGYTNLKYRIMGDQLEFIPIPSSGQPARLWYIPMPTSLQFMPTCSTTAASTSVSLPDVGSLLVGMSVSGPGIQPSTTITAINTTTNVITISLAAQATAPYATLQFWRDDTQINGISGWEEYVVIDAAIKAKIKQEEDYSALADQKMAMKKRIEDMSEGRDAGQAHHVSDVMSINGGMDGCGDGWGGGYGGMGGF